MTRTEIFKQMEGNPLEAMKVVFGISRNSQFSSIYKHFKVCADQTGCSNAVSNAVRSFKNEGVVQDFILQYCSAKVANAASS